MYPKTRWTDLKGERATIFKGKVIEDGDWHFEGETTEMWKQMVNYIRTTKEVLVESKGRRHYNKETWWWSAEVLEAARETRHYKVWQGTRNMENYEIYKKTKKETKKVVSDAKCRPYDVTYLIGWEQEK